jgi:hypothetical protein
MDRKLIGILAVALMMLIGNPPSSEAVIFLSGSGNLGSFSGSFEYTATNSTTATIDISLKNTTPAISGGYITAFAFNNPSNLITGITLNPSDPHFALIGSPFNNNGVNGAPNGQFDIGVSTGGSYEGGGNPSEGIDNGVTETFTFSLTGNNLDTLLEQTFFETTSDGSQGAGEGVESFVVRFRGFANGGSDKVPHEGGCEFQGGCSTVPEPASVLLFSSGLVGAFLRRKRS